WTLRVEREGGEFRVTTWEQGALYRYRARSVIVATPLFLAPTLIPSLPEAQRAAIATLQYRAYVVANVLLRRKADAIFRAQGLRAGYELTRVHGVDVATTPTRDLSSQKVYSDAIHADFVMGRHPSHAVLTVYRPYPCADGRQELLGASYADIEAEVRREVLAGFGPHGLRASDIEGVQLCRWGHPMIVARPGQMADGTMAAAGQSQPGLYFCHTDTMGAPAYENAFAAAHDAVAAVTGFLRV
ncbi:MAG: FAD-dependent oxidoreductase, partial [Gammaproteobacteria bacterium]|nr:FAD-dependent oxidoreductase [Gammaproteobacteria bacterium]